jgi:hypothetical protein
MPAILNCAILLVNPAIFASIAANHCRRVPPYFIALTPVPWLTQSAFLWREHLVFGSEPIAVGVSTLVGLAWAYWILGRKKRSFRTEMKELATDH